ncbi:TPA: ABC transporter ATP-binding protein, partial [Clostridioides difficile]|nr:ABC transporter ATP-binding protein [Clostridioides difficile]
EKSLSWIEVSDGHFVYSSKSEINKYQQNLKVV